MEINEAREFVAHRYGKGGRRLLFALIWQLARRVTQLEGRAPPSRAEFVEQAAQLKVTDG